MWLVGNEWVMVLLNDASELQEVVLHELHGSALGGHLGHGKLESLVRCRFYLPTLGADVHKFC